MKKMRVAAVVLTAVVLFPQSVYAQNSAMNEKPVVVEIASGQICTDIPIADKQETGNAPDLLREAAGSALLTVQSHTPQEIIDYVNAVGVDMNAPVEFSVVPEVSGSYAPGKLADQTLDQALKMVNTIRYIAGLPGQVTLSQEYCELCQAGALVNYANGQLSHFPVQPAGMSDELFSKGYTGCSKSNIAWASWVRSVNDTIINSWMEDNDASNIAYLGHRRWILNPSMGQTGFGAIAGTKGTYSQMYALDRSGQFTDVTGVMWPAQNMPIEFLNSNTPWSISFGQRLNDDVSVELTRTSDGKSWFFSKNQTEDGYFNVENSGYGQIGCVIFQPKDISAFNSGDVYQVCVRGVGQEDVSYTVSFFSLFDMAAPRIEPQSIVIEQSSVLIKKGDVVKLNETVAPEDAYDRSVLWSSSNPDVATVADNGVVTAQQVGSAVITATTVNGLKAECTVGVSLDTVVYNPFADILADSGWEYTAAKYVYDKGLMKGKEIICGTKSRFEPKASITRAEFVTVLYSKENKPETAYSDVFGDVAEGKWYTGPILWAQSTGLVKGYANSNLFGVSDPITREQIAQILYVYARSKGYDVSIEDVSLDRFTDVDKISSWAMTAIKWANSKGVLNGSAGDEPKLNPTGNATRAECAAMLRSFITKVEGIEE